MNTATAALRHHVTGAIERGEAEAVHEIRPMPTDSPWGRVQTGTLYGRIWSIDTAGHGGMLVPEDLMDTIPPKQRAFAKRWSGSAQWFEEDCAAACVIVTFPDWFPADWQESAQRQVDHYKAEGEM